MGRCNLALFILLILPFCAAAQRPTLNPEKMNVLYIGIENPLDLRLDGKHCRDYGIAMQGASIKPSKDACRYLVYPTIPGGQTMYVLNVQGKSVDSMLFRVRHVPDPIAYLIGKVNGHTDPRMLTGVGVMFECFDFDYKMTVYSCEVSLKHRGEINGGHRNGSGLFDTETRRLLDGAQQGDVLIVSNIRAGGPDSAIRLLNDLVVVLAW